MPEKKQGSRGRTRDAEEEPGTSENNQGHRRRNRDTEEETGTPEKKQGSRGRTMDAEEEPGASENNQRHRRRIRTNGEESGTQQKNHGRRRRRGQRKASAPPAFSDNNMIQLGCKKICNKPYMNGRESYSEKYRPDYRQ